MDRPEVLDEESRSSSIKQTCDKGGERRLVLLIRIDPVCHPVGFPDDLDHVLLQPLGIDTQLCRTRLFQRPAPHQRLVDHVLIDTLGGERALDHPLQLAIHPAPAIDRRPPFGRDFAEHRDPGAHVLTSLGVMRRGVDHRAGPVSLPGPVLPVELLDARAEFARVTANFVEGGQAVEPVEGGVLEPLRHDRAGELLELHRKATAAVLAIDRIFRILTEKHALHEVEDGDVHVGLAPFRELHCLLDIATIEGIRASIGTGRVRPVDGEAGKDLPQCLAKVALREVTREPILLRDPVQGIRKHVHLTGERLSHHPVLHLVHELGESNLVPGEPGVDPVEQNARLRIDEHPGRGVGELVADGARDRPILAQCLPVLEDLLCHDVQRKEAALRHDPVEGRGDLGADFVQHRVLVGILSVVRQRFRPPGPRYFNHCRLLKTHEVRLRVPKPVRVVDPDAIDRPFGDQLQQQSMRLLEDGIDLLTDRGQGVDGEESPVIDLLGGNAP